MFNKRIYLDYASLTPIDRRVIREMRRFSASKYANPSSWYKEGVNAKSALESARKRIAGCIRAHADEIVFTSGGTEANNMAILGAYEEAKEPLLRSSQARSYGGQEGERRVWKFDGGGSRRREGAESECAPSKARHVPRR